MHITWLGWAGVQLHAAGESIVVDLLGDPTGVLAGTGLSAPMPTVVAPSDQGGVLAALCTHLHRDHADAGALTAALRPGADVFVPRGFGGDDHENLWTLTADSEFEAAGLPRREVDPWQTMRVGPFSIAAIPAVDTLGDPQVSWVIEAEGRRVIHLGDTMFHGYWWRTKHRFGPIDAVLTPINGPVVCFPHCMPPSPYPAALDAEHAAVAARLLGARVAVPIHYDGFQVDGFYETQSDELARFARAAVDEPFAVEALSCGGRLAL